MKVYKERVIHMQRCAPGTPKTMNHGRQWCHGFLTRCPVLPPAPLQKPESLTPVPGNDMGWYGIASYHAPSAVLPQLPQKINSVLAKTKAIWKGTVRISIQKELFRSFFDA